MSLSLAERLGDPTLEMRARIPGIFSLFGRRCVCGVLLPAILICLPHIAVAQYALPLLESAGISQLSGTLTRVYGPALLPKDLLEKEEARIRNEVQTNFDPDGSSIIRQAEAKIVADKLVKRLKEGGSDSFKFALFLGKGEALLQLKQLNEDGKVQLETWELQQVDTSIEFTKNVSTILVQPMGLNQKTMLGIISYAMGCLGDPKSLGIASLSSNGDIRIKEFPDMAFRYAVGQQGMIEKLIKDSSEQDLSWEFGKFAPVATRFFIPLEISQRLRTKTRTEEVRIAIEDFQVAPPIVPLQLPDFGLASVTDTRFEPTLSYSAKGSLPSQEVVSKMVADPQFRKQYSEDAKAGGR